MGLGSKLRNKNKQNARNLEHAKTSMTTGGYNTDNISGLTVVSMSNDDYTEVNDAIQDSSRKINGVTQSKSLVKPTIPYNGDNDRNTLNALIVEKIWSIIIRNKYEAFYTQSKLQAIVDRACLHDYRLLMQQWGIETFEQAADLAVVSLCDVVFLIDDSGSTATSDEDGMTRAEVIENILETNAFWASLMDEDGIVIKPFNNDIGVAGLGVSTIDQVKGICESLPNPRVTRYRTPIARTLQSVADEYVLPFVRDGTLERPVLIIVLTDGAADHPKRVKKVIQNIHNEIKNTKYGDKAIMIGFQQVGNDEEAEAFLDDLDNDPVIGHFIDCNSSYVKENAQCMTNNGISLTPAEYLVKGLIGPIDDDYDNLDQAGASTSRNVAPPTQSYGQPTQSYGQPQPTPYGQSQPAQQSYGQGPPMTYGQVPQNGQPAPYGQPQPTSYGQSAPPQYNQYNQYSTTAPNHTSNGPQQYRR